MMNGILDKIRQWWQSLKQIQKILFIVGFTGILVTVAVLGQLALHPAYAPLFTELEPKDAAKIIEELDAAKTPYRLTNNGKNIEVPEEQVYKLRIQMASAGLLYESGVGFELFDEKKFGITEFEQHVGYQRALQEELRRTIVQLDEVEQARVHLVLPRDSVFLDEQVTPSASVALKLKDYAKLDPAQIKGMQSLVMGSIQGLTPDNIHIIDMQGNVLNENLAEDDDRLLSAVAMDRYEVQKKIEREMENSIQNMINRILGPGRAVAQVVAELDFDREETIRTEYGPSAVLSEETLVESGTGSANGGLAGTDTEFPGNTMPFMDEAAGSTYEREHQVTNYEVDATQQTTVKAPGNIRRLSVSVVVDGEYTQAQLDSLQQVVASAVGYNTTRGDQLTVSSMAFSEPELTGLEEPEPGAAEQIPFNTSVIAAGVASGVLLLLALFMLLRRRAARRRREALEQQWEEEEALRRSAAELLEEKDIVFEEPKPGYRSRIRDMASQKPSELVEILKVWLRE